MIVARMEGVGFTPGRSGRPALAGVSLEVAAGEVLLLEGPSGSGKSTLLRALAGLVPHFHGGRFRGRVEVCGHDTRHIPPARLAGRVGALFQDPEAQAVRSVVARDVAFGLENLGVPAERIPRRVDEALERAGAVHLRDRAIATLSGGERQRVALAGVLALGPQLLLLDEPASQLDADGVGLLCEAIAALAHGGTAVVIAEHRAAAFAGVADRSVTLRDGRIGAPAPEETACDLPAVDPGEELLILTGVCAGYGGPPVLDGCDLTLRAGTVTALHGPNGAGKSTLARIVAGLIAPDRGTVSLRGRDITRLPVERRHPAIGLLTQDAGRWLLRERVADEVAFGLHRLEPPDRIARTAAALAALDLEAHAGRHPLDLSVGERERVALAATLAPDPDVVVLDEPSRGMDPARKRALAATLRAHARRGAAVLVATHDEALAATVADRHLTLADGRLAERASLVTR